MEESQSCSKRCNQRNITRTKAIEEMIEHLSFCQSEYYADFGPQNMEEIQVLTIAEHQGYGRLMQLLANEWMRKDPDGALVSGTCAVFVNEWKKAFKVDIISEV